MEEELIVHPARRTLGLALVVYAGAMLFVFIFSGSDAYSGGGPLGAPLMTGWRVFWLAGAVCVGYVYLLYRTTTLRVSRDEVTKRSGVFVRNFMRTEIDKVTNYTYHRSLFDLVFGFVNIEIESSGATDVTPAMSMRFLCMRDFTAIMEKIRTEKEALTRRRAMQRVEQRENRTAEAAKRLVGNG